MTPLPKAHGLDPVVPPADGPPASEEDIDRLRLSWEAYGRGDLDALAELFDPEVGWCGDGDPSAGCQNRQEVLQFIHQARADGGNELLDLRPIGEKMLAVSQRHHPSEWGQPLEPHGGIIRLRDGKVSEKVVYPTVQEALDAVSPE